MKYLRFEEALKSKVYTDIIDEASKRLMDDDEHLFKKDEVLEATGYWAVADSIRWDYIRKALEDKHGTELIPLASSFFKKGAKRNIGGDIAKSYISGAGGGPKGTHGYALVCKENGDLIHTALEHKNLSIQGQAKRTKKFVEIGNTALENGNLQVQPWPIEETAIVSDKPIMLS